MRPEQEALLDLRAISLYGLVDKEMQTYVEDTLRYFVDQGSPDIMVFISSSGGDHCRSMRICQALSEYPGKTVGYVQIQAYSGAVTILQGCTIRKMRLGAELMIHEPSLSDRLSLSELKNAELIKRLTADLEDCFEELCILFSGRSGRHTPQYFADQCHKGTNITAEEALQMGLVDEIAS